LSADQLVEALRPTLQAQEAELLELLFGSGPLGASGCDLFYVPSSTTGAGFLFFVSAQDRSGSYLYSRPGFFTDPALEQIASTSAALDGTADEVHQKVAVSQGALFYFADDTGAVYRLEITEVTEGESPEIGMMVTLEGTP
jgi:hypothetical protein